MLYFFISFSHWWLLLSVALGTDEIHPIATYRLSWLGNTSFCFRPPLLISDMTAEGVHAALSVLSSFTADNFTLCGYLYLWWLVYVPVFVLVWMLCEYHQEYVFPRSRFTRQMRPTMPFQISLGAYRQFIYAAWIQSKHWFLLLIILTGIGVTDISGRTIMGYPCWGTQRLFFYTFL